MLEAQSESNEIKTNTAMWSHTYICSSGTRKQYNGKEIRGMKDV